MGHTPADGLQSRKPAKPAPELFNSRLWALECLDNGNIALAEVLCYRSIYLWARLVEPTKIAAGGSITTCVERLRNGDDRGLDELIPLAYGALKTLAQHQLNLERPDNTLSATALVHEAYLRLSKQNRFWSNLPVRFKRVVLRLHEHSFDRRLIPSNRHRTVSCLHPDR